MSAMPWRARLRSIVRPSDTVWWGQGTAEPVTLTRALVADRHALAAPGRLRVFVGVGASDTLQPEYADVLDFFGYAASGRHRALAEAGVLDILPNRYAQLPLLIESGRLAVDVVFLQVSPPDPRGRYSLGQAREYLPAALGKARAVVGEVNPEVPWTQGGPYLTADDFALRADAEFPPLEMPPGPVSATERAVAERVAGLVEDGATLQLGIGKLPAATLAALRDHRDLGLHSGAVTDGVVDLTEAGVLTNARKSVDLGVAVGGILMGTGRLRRWAAQNSTLQLRETEYTHDAAVLARSHRFTAINSAIEIDLTGQVNAEVADGVYVGAIGGAPDFLRGAAASPGGLPILALKSTTRNGASRIVSRLSGPVSTPRTETAVVVTEHGIADLRGQTLAQRARSLIDIAAPSHRAGLEREAHGLLRRCGARFS